MVALFYDSAVIHDHNQIGIPDSGQAMRNNDTGAVFHYLLHGGLDRLFCAGVHVGSGFVQNQNLWICHKSRAMAKSCLCP